MYMEHSTQETVCFHPLKKDWSLCFSVLNGLKFLGKRGHLGYLSQPPVVDRTTWKLIRQQLNSALFVCRCSHPKDLPSSANTHFWSLKAGVSVPRLALQPLSPASLSLPLSEGVYHPLLAVQGPSCFSLHWCHFKRTKACEPFLFSVKWCFFSYFTILYIKIM